MPFRAYLTVQLAAELAVAFRRLPLPCPLSPLALAVECSFLRMAVARFHFLRSRWLVCLRPRRKG